MWLCDELNFLPLHSFAKKDLTLNLLRAYKWLPQSEIGRMLCMHTTPKTHNKENETNLPRLFVYLFQYYNFEMIFFFLLLVRTNIIFIYYLICVNNKKFTWHSSHKFLLYRKEYFFSFDFLLSHLVYLFSINSMKFGENTHTYKTLFNTHNLSMLYNRIVRKEINTFFFALTHTIT